VNTQEAGEADLRVLIQDTDFELVDVDTRLVDNGLYECVYKPCKLARHLIIITYGGVVIPHSPFRVRNLSVSFSIF
jgi:hypothetical protein